MAYSVGKEELKHLDAVGVFIVVVFLAVQREVGCRVIFLQKPAVVSTICGSDIQGPTQNNRDCACNSFYMTNSENQLRSSLK